MEPPLKVSKPVIPSQLQAEKQAHFWTTNHSTEKMLDGDGLEWKVEKTFREIHSQEDSKKLIWEAKIQLKVDVNVKILVETKTLDPEFDERFIDLIGEADIPLAMKPILLRANTPEELEKITSEHLQHHKSIFRERSLKDIKYSLIGKWIDHGRQFQNSLTRR